MHAGTLVRTVRLLSGLILMTFVAGHLSNLAIGMHSLAAMEASATAHSRTGRTAARPSSNSKQR